MRSLLKFSDPEGEQLGVQAWIVEGDRIWGRIGDHYLNPKEPTRLKKIRMISEKGIVSFVETI